MTGKRTCNVDGCIGKVKARGWCNKHYDRWRRFGDPEAVVKNGEQGCSVDGCDGVHMARGLCRLHYKRWQRLGNPGEPESRKGHDLADRVFASVAFVDKWHGGTRCLEWQGKPSTPGYAITTTGKRNERVYVHRWMYERWVGPIPEGLHIDHLCMNKMCVNPMHLEAVTTQENTRRFREAVRSGRVPDPWAAGG